MRIAVIGPQNTGKSTFIEDFLKDFAHYTSPKETYRDVIESRGLAVNQKTSLESQKEIRDFMFGQIRHNMEYNVIFDRCLIDNYIYTLAQYEKGEIPKWFLDETESMMKDTLSLVDLYLFIPTAVSVPFVDDATRDITASYIDSINYYFLRTLFTLSREHHITIKVISGSRKERIEQIKRII
jgi:nicotinamide riboside kinase